MRKEEISLGYFIRFLVAELAKSSESKPLTLPFKDEQLWHELLFSLYNERENTGAILPFLQDIQFDWDYHYPICRQLSQFLQAVHWNAGVAAFNPRWETITVSDDDAKRWEEILSETDQDVQILTKKTANRAKELFALS